MSDDQEMRSGLNGGLIKAPWKPGQSGNPTGLGKDGVARNQWTKLEDRLHRSLRRRGKAQALVDSWVDAAIGGSDAAREQILKRLYPIPNEDVQGIGKIVREGVRLELTSKGMTIAIGGEKESQDGASPMQLPQVEAPREVEIELPQESQNPAQVPLAQDPEV